MTLIPGIKQISQVGNDMYAQGAITIAGIGTTNVDYLADPADTRLLAGRDPVIEEVSVGMSGVETDQKYATGAQPLTVTDAIQGNLTYCEVQFSPKQDLHGYDSPWPAGGGANQWDEEWELGAISSVDGNNNPSSVNIRSKNYIPIKPSAAYYAYCPSITSNLRARFYDADKAYIGYLQKDGTACSWNNIFVAPNNAYYMRFEVQDSYGTTYNHNISINYPATVTTYQPYANICPITGTDTVNVYVAESYDPAAAPEATVSLGAERYGGTADLVSGTGSEDRKEADLGAIDYIYDSSVPRFYKTNFDPNAKLPATASDIPNCMCECYKIVSTNDIWNLAIDGAITISHTGTLNIKDSRFSTVEGLKAALSGTKFVYELATPPTFTFPGANDITLQEGTNTIWTDTNGPDISVTYVTKK